MQDEKKAQEEEARRQREDDESSSTSKSEVEDDGKIANKKRTINLVDNSEDEDVEEIEVRVKKPRIGVKKITKITIKSKFYTTIFN